MAQDVDRVAHVQGLGQDKRGHVDVVIVMGDLSNLCTRHLLSPFGELPITGWRSSPGLPSFPYPRTIDPAWPGVPSYAGRGGGSARIASGGRRPGWPSAHTR